MNARRTLALLLLAIWGLLQPARAAAIPVETFEVPPGVSLIVSRQTQIPVVFIVMVLPGGTLAEPAGKAGLAAVTAELLQRGTKAHPGKSLAGAFDAIGAEWSVDASSDMVTVSLSALTDHLDEALDLLGEVLATPAFEAADFEKVRAEAIASLKASAEDPGYLAGRALLAMLYDGHPYGTPVSGTEATLASLTLEDCRNYWRRVAGPAGVVITAAGDADGKDLAGRLRRSLGAWLSAGGSVFKEAPPHPPRSGDSELKKINGPFTQTTILLGERGITRNDPAYYALQVFNYSLGGGGFSSRLLDEIRDNRGLAYSVSSSFDTRLLPGPFEISLQTRNATAKESLALVRAEVAKALEKGITEKELEDAKAYLVGTYPRRYDTNAKMAGFLAAAVFYGLGTDYDRVYPERIRAVSREVAGDAARAHVHSGGLDTVVVGNLREAGFEK